MSDLYLVAKTNGSARVSAQGKFQRKLAITLFATACDFAVLAIVGPLAFQCAFLSHSLPVAFSVLAFGMLASLAYMWYCTVQKFPGSMQPLAHAQHLNCLFSYDSSLYFPRK